MVFQLSNKFQDFRLMRNPGRIEKRVLNVCGMRDANYKPMVSSFIAVCCIKGPNGTLLISSVGDQRVRSRVVAYVRLKSRDLIPR